MLACGTYEQVHQVETEMDKNLKLIMWFRMLCILVNGHPIQLYLKFQNEQTRGLVEIWQSLVLTNIVTF